MKKRISKTKNKFVSTALAFLIVFQTVAGVFLPVEISLEPPYVKIQETQAEGEEWLAGRALASPGYFYNNISTKCLFILTSHTI